MTPNPTEFAAIFGPYIAKKRDKKQREKKIDLTKPFIVDDWIIASDGVEYLSIRKDIIDFTNLPTSIFSTKAPETGLSITPKGADDLKISVKRLLAFVDMALKSGYDILYNIGCDTDLIRGCTQNRPITCSCIDRKNYRHEYAMVNIYGNLFFAYQLRHVLNTCDLFGVEEIGLRYGRNIGRCDITFKPKVSPHRITLKDGLIIMLGVVPIEEPFN